MSEIAGLADMAELKRLEEVCFQLDRLSRRSLRRLLERPSASVVVERDPLAGRLRGAVLLLWRTGSRKGRIYSLAVDPSCRRQGVAARLLQVAEQLARQRGCIRLGAEIRIDNHGSRAAFAQAGFAVCGHRTGYYADGADAVVVQKRLSAPC